MGVYDQKRYQIRMEWGKDGVAQLSPVSDITVIIDVLSFTTCVDIAVGNGAVIYPFEFKDARAAGFARVKSAILASSRRSTKSYSLSPHSLINLPADHKLVLPSPNGSSLSLRAKSSHVVAGCLRNARSVAEYCTGFDSVALIPAGEGWPDGGLRPCLEDLLGAGAICSYLEGRKSPEAQAAEKLFASMRDSLIDHIEHCTSGHELSQKGFAKDVRAAAELNCSLAVPVLKDGCYIAA
jgi:2-phosphosulfolactate phosphatase